MSKITLWSRGWKSLAVAMGLMVGAPVWALTFMADKVSSVEDAMTQFNFKGDATYLSGIGPDPASAKFVLILNRSSTDMERIKVCEKYFLLKMMNQEKYLLKITASPHAYGASTQTYTMYPSDMNSVKCELSVR